MRMCGLNALKLQPELRRSYQWKKAWTHIWWTYYVFQAFVSFHTILILYILILHVQLFLRVILCYLILNYLYLLGLLFNSC